MSNTKTAGRVLPVGAMGLALLLGACDAESEPGEATLRITTYGESYIEERIPADVLVDGWELELSRFLVAIRDIEVDGEPLPGSFVVDLRSPSMGEGHELGELLVPAGGSPLVDFRIGPVTEAEPVATTQEVALMMINEGHSLVVEGQARRDGQTIDFAWSFDNDTLYHGCQSTAELVDGGEAESQLTIHADHLFYDDLDSPEPNVAFDLVAAADGNADGVVTMDELAAVDITGQSRYQVGSRDIGDLWGFIEAQTSTLGHIDGEGHCEQR